MDHLCLRRVARLLGIQTVAAGRNGNPSGEKHRAACLPALFPGHRRLCRRQVLYPKRNTLCYSAARGALDRGDERPYFNGGFDTRGARHHAECLHRLYVERVCDSGLALHVFCAGGLDGFVSLPSLRPFCGADFYRGEDAGVSLFRYSYGVDVGGCPFFSGRFHPGFAVTSTKDRVARTLLSAPTSKRCEHADRSVRATRFHTL